MKLCKMKSSPIVRQIILWTAALPFIAAQHEYKNYSFTVPRGGYEQFEGYLTQFGTIDIRYLTLSSTQNSPTDKASTFEVAVFRLPDACVTDNSADDEAAACALLPTEVGIGATLPDNTTAKCCTQDLFNDNKCGDAELGRLIVNNTLFDLSQIGDVEVPAQNAWVHHIDWYYGLYEEYEAGKYVTMFANCNEEDGRNISVTGKADFGAEIKPYDFFSELHQCGVPIDLNPYYDVDDNGSDVLLDFLFDPVANKCDGPQNAAFDKALDDFGQCSGLHWKTFIESFPSALLGNVIHCGYWGKEISKWVDKQMEEYDDGDSFHETFAPNWSEIYNLTGREECFNALEGHSVFGETLHKFVFEPDDMCKCVKSLQQAVPLCTKDEWPIPLVGNWMNISACLIQSGCLQLEKACEVELEFLDSHLQTGLDGKMDCSSIEGFQSTSFALNLPPEYSGAPLPDTCVRIANTSPFAPKKITERYEAYRTQCTSMWDGWASQSDQKSSTGSDSKGLGAGASAAIVLVSYGAAMALAIWGRSKLRKQNSDQTIESAEHPDMHKETNFDNGEGATGVELGVVT